MVQGSIPAALSWIPIRLVLVALVTLGSLLLLRRLVGHPLTAPLRRRFVLGLPWGTVLTVLGVLLVYAVVQGGWENPRSPLVLPFRSWGYDYLLGTLAASFTHNGWNHLVNNVTSTIAFAGVAEYALGHYPRRRGTSTFTSLQTNPYARILVVPAFALVVGIFTSVSGLGPLIGFSGVVFAFGGFAIVQAPIAAILALVGIRILRLLLSTVQNPAQPASIYEAVITPWWAEVAIQTHAVGMILGLLAGIGLARYRRDWSNPLHVWFAALVFAIAQGMWAIFLPVSASSWLLLRWIGAISVFVLATLAAIGAVGSDRRLVGRIDLHRRELAVGLLVIAIGAMSLAAVPFHVASVGEEPAPNGVVEIRDYTVGYGEDVPEGYVDAVELPVGEIPTVPASGVIVTSEKRNMWRQAVPTEELASNGRASVLVGGLGWQERVYADWVGWRVAGNQSVYKVFLAPETGEWEQAFTSPPSRSDVVIAGYNLSIVPAETDFTIIATEDSASIGPVSIPANGTQQAIGPITLERDEQRLIAIHNGTRVPIATRVEQAR